MRNGFFVFFGAESPIKDRHYEPDIGCDRLSPYRFLMNDVEHKRGMGREMKVLKTRFKKNTVAVFLSVGLVGSCASLAFAAIDTNLLNRQVGNELPARFNVLAPVDSLVLSWDAAALDTTLGSYDLVKDKAHTVTYYVSPAEDNIDDLTVDVLLKVDSASANALQTLQVDGDAISSAFTEDGYNYYVLKEGLEIEASDLAFSDTFDITFNQASTSNAPFAASLIAVKEEEEEQEETGLKTETPQLSSFYKEPYNPQTSMQYWAGETTQNMKLFFYPAEETTDGVAVIKLGDGIASLDIATSSLTVPGSPVVTDLTSYWDAATKTLTLPITVPSFPRECYLDLKGLIFSSTTGDYTMSLTMDQDGAGTEYAVSDADTKTITIQAPH